MLGRAVNPGGRTGGGVPGRCGSAWKGGAEGAGAGAQPAGALTAALAPSLPSPALLPPSLPGRGRVSAARRPGNAADAPRSIPGGGSAPVLPLRRRGLGPARRRRPAQGQGACRAGRRGSWRSPAPACPRRASSSSAWRGAARRRPRTRRDLPLLKPERDWLRGSRAASTAAHPGAWAFPLPAPAPAAPCTPALRLRLQPSSPCVLLLPLFQFPRLRLADYCTVLGLRGEEGNWPVIA